MTQLPSGVTEFLRQRDEASALGAPGRPPLTLAEVLNPGMGEDYIDLRDVDMGGGITQWYGDPGAMRNMPWPLSAGTAPQIYESHSAIPGRQFGPEYSPEGDPLAEVMGAGGGGGGDDYLSMLQRVEGDPRDQESQAAQLPVLSHDELADLGYSPETEMGPLRSQPEGVGGGDRSDWARGPRDEFGGELPEGELGAEGRFPHLGGVPTADPPVPPDPAAEAIMSGAATRDVANLDLFGDEGVPPEHAALQERFNLSPDQLDKMVAHRARRKRERGRALPIEDSKKLIFQSALAERMRRKGLVSPEQALLMSPDGAKATARIREARFKKEGLVEGIGKQEDTKRKKIASDENVELRKISSEERKHSKQSKLTKWVVTANNNALKYTKDRDASIEACKDATAVTQTRLTTESDKHIHSELMSLSSQELALKRQIHKDDNALQGKALTSEIEMRKRNQKNKDALVVLEQTRGLYEIEADKRSQTEAERAGAHGRGLETERQEYDIGIGGRRMKLEEETGQYAMESDRRSQAERERAGEHGRALETTGQEHEIAMGKGDLRIREQTRKDNRELRESELGIQSQKIASDALAAGRKSGLDEQTIWAQIANDPNISYDLRQHAETKLGIIRTSMNKQGSRRQNAANRLSPLQRTELLDPNLSADEKISKIRMIETDPVRQAQLVNDLAQPGNIGATTKDPLGFSERPMGGIQWTNKRAMLKHWPEGYYRKYGTQADLDAYYKRNPGASPGSKKAFKKVANRWSWQSIEDPNSAENVW